MRVAILADIHSNLQALAKAFSIIDRSRVDEVYCLGDIVGYGANPNECVDMIRKRCTVSVLGNHDLAAIDISAARYFTSPGRTAAEWTNAILTPDNLDYLRSLQYLVAHESATCVHASPHEPRRWNYVSSLDIAQRQFPAFSTNVCFIGHTHIPFVCSENLKTFTFRKGMRFLVNVGSVGQPRDGNAHLSFGIFDSDQWSYQNIRSEYDIDGASQAILDRGLPPVLAKRLFLGQ